MKENKSSYRQIIKATSLFGGVQVFNIIIAIIRSKFVAILLGPTGMGIAGLLNTAINLIGGATNFGLGTSAVKDIASANGSENEEKISKIVSVFKNLVWATGILGTIITIILSPYLSVISFGNKNYTYSFIWLSVTLLLTQLASGQKVLLQGLRKLKLLAKANMLGSLISLVLTIPIYYFYQLDGIVPAIILTSFFSLLIAYFYSKKVKIRKYNLSFKEIIINGKEMLQMGFALSLNNLIVIGTSFIIRIFINNYGNISDVGLYSAGFSIIGTYVGLVFAAMATDYYPRLSGIAQDNAKAKLLINQQAEISILILSPILTIFLIFIDWIIILLYSTKFVEVNEMIHWAALGMYFKAISWAISFIFMAKGLPKMFFYNEVIANTYLLCFSLVGYYVFGLEGLGISFIIGYFFYLIQVYVISKNKFEFSLNKEFIYIFILQFVFGIICFISTKYISSPWSYIIGLPTIILSCWFSYKELDNRIGIQQLLTKFNKK